MRYAAFLAFAFLAVAQQPPPKKQQRDLKIENIETPSTPTGKAVAIPHSYAVMVGISRYQNLPEKDQLHFAERDAQSIYSILISPTDGNFKQKNVRVLTSANATLAGMRREIDNWLPATAKKGDRVLIYFAGHGFMYQSKGYLAPYDFKKENI
ncbi:MAG TPA: caspase family protein, partial [Bryobacteraceae bacterium]